jgi:hypothetical protein
MGFPFLEDVGRPEPPVKLGGCLTDRLFNRRSARSTEIVPPALETERSLEAEQLPPDFL